MTDTTSHVLTAPLGGKADDRYLFSPWMDFLCLGGGAVVILSAISLAFPHGLSKAAIATIVLVLMTLINQPHFAHSYQIFYSNFGSKMFGATYGRALRLRYFLSGLVVPAALLGFFAMSLMRSDARMLSFGANAMFFLVGWHYVKQGYGILMLDAAQKKLYFSDPEKLVFRMNGYACWLVAWFAVNHTISRAVSYLGVTYYTPETPTPIYQIMMVVAAGTTLAALLALFLRWRERRRLPWNGVVAYLTTLYLWVAFTSDNPLIVAIIPTFHSLQYLLVVWRYGINATRATAGTGEIPASREMGRRHPWKARRKFGTFVLLGLLLGYLGFNGVPRELDNWIHYDHALFGPSAFLFMFYIFINVHHYFLDNVMWRRGNPDVGRFLFSRSS